MPELGHSMMSIALLSYTHTHARTYARLPLSVYLRLCASDYRPPPPFLSVMLSMMLFNVCVSVLLHLCRVRAHGMIE